MSGVTRRVGSAQRQAEGLTAQALEAIVRTVCLPRRSRGGSYESEETARRRGQTDIAMVSLMRDAMLRVSETADLRWEDITEEEDGTGRLLIRRSKTDGEGESAVAFVSSQTMIRLALMREGAAEQGSVFGLRGNQITRRIKRAAHAAGLGDGFSGHSPRVGMAQDLARAGTELPRLMTAGRWRSPRMPALYTRNETISRGAVAQYYGSRDDRAEERLGDSMNDGSGSSGLEQTVPVDKFMADGARMGAPHHIVDDTDRCRNEAKGFIKAFVNLLVPGVEILSPPAAFCAIPTSMSLQVTPVDCLPYA